MSLRTDPVAIEIKALKKYFKEVKAVDGISLNVKKGELFSILGPNGAGKTTLVRMLTTVLTPTAGDANINGHSILTRKNEIVKKGMRVMVINSGVFMPTCSKIVSGSCKNNLIH